MMCQNSGKFERSHSKNHIVLIWQKVIFFGEAIVVMRTFN